MNIYIGTDKQDMAQHAADAAAAKIREAIAARGEARIIVATGARMGRTLAALVKEPGIDWTKVTGFHLDEYVGIPVAHKASFRGYMRERFVSKTPQPMKVFNEVDGEAVDPAAECARLERLVREAPIDVACIGFGENGHIAFNDPPADFDTNAAYKVVPLDEKCRMQQVGEGWFPDRRAHPRLLHDREADHVVEGDRLHLPRRPQGRCGEGLHRGPRHQPVPRLHPPDASRLRLLLRPARRRQARAVTCAPRRVEVPRVF